MKHLAPLLFFVLLLYPALAAADALEDAVHAYNQEDYISALERLRPLAQQGDARAQVFLGLLHDKGAGVPQDSGRAAHYYRLAAEQGLAEAQFMLGMMRGKARDFIHAHMWLNLAAGQGDSLAAVILEGLVQQMAPAQLTKAQKLAQECKAQNYQDCGL